MASNFVRNALGIFYSSSSGVRGIGYEPTPSLVHDREEKAREEKAREEKEENVREEGCEVGVEPPVSPDSPAPPVSPDTYPLNARGMQVVDSLFYSPGVRGRPVLSWKAFEDMMGSLGFVEENGEGTRRRFVPGPTAQERGWLATINFNQPRNDEIPLEVAREWGRRLAGRYGWSSQTFVQE
ncbi:hypothetical protein SLS62_006345 [Diatrype stigma]|uniref:Uncharacterized protein n=1 Tax=Diatrype stigma TaxID=117547 RepID=A0AAN9YRP9_9PEZI